MKTVVYYSVTGRSRSVAEGVSVSLGAARCELKDRFSSQPPGWKRDARRAARAASTDVFDASEVALKKGDTLVLVFPYWGGPLMPAIIGFIRAVDLHGIAVFLVMTHVRGGDGLLMLLQDEVVRQGGAVQGIFSVGIRWKTTQRLQTAGGKIGKQIASLPSIIPLSLQERLEHAIDHEHEAEVRYLQLVEMTPNQRMRTWLKRQAGEETSRVQILQQLYRTYAGLVYEPGEDCLAPLPAEKVLDYASFVQGLKETSEKERAASLEYHDIAESFPSQQDVVRQALFLFNREQRHCRTMNGIYRRFSRSSTLP